MASYEGILRTITPWLYKPPADEGMRSLPPVEVVADREYDFSNPDYSPYMRTNDALELPVPTQGFPLTAPTMADMGQRLPPAAVDMSNPDLSPYLAQANAQDLSKAPVEERSIPPIKKAMGGSEDDRFTKMMLAIGSGLLSAPGSKGLSAAGANALEVMNQLQKREDDQVLKAAKVAQIQADIAKKGRPTVSKLSDGSAILTFNDGTTQPVTDAELRQLNIDTKKAGLEVSQAKIDKMKADIGSGRYKWQISNGVLVKMDTKGQEPPEVISDPALIDQWKQSESNKTERAVTIAEGKARVTPMSPKLQEAEDKDIEAIDTATGLNTRLNDYFDMIDKGTLKLGPTENLKSEASGRTGIFTDENSRNYMLFKTELEDLRNKTLLLNKGVQTEGDAVRAMNSIMQNLHDPEYVKQQLKIVMQKNAEAVELRKKLIDKRRRENLKAPIDPETGAPKEAPKGASGGLPDAALRQLKEGQETEFKNGQVWTLKNGKPERVK